MIYQGTTPIIIGTVDVEFDYSNVYATIEQDGVIVTKSSRQSNDIEITKNYDEETGEFVSSTVAMYLSQQETLKFEAGKARSQLRWVDILGNAQATDIKANIEFAESLYQEVITYGD